MNLHTIEPTSFVGRPCRIIASPFQNDMNIEVGTVGYCVGITRPDPNANSLETYYQIEYPWNWGPGDLENRVESFFRSEIEWL